MWSILEMALCMTLKLMISMLTSLRQLPAVLFDNKAALRSNENCNNKIRLIVTHSLLHAIAFTYMYIDVIEAWQLI